MNYLAQKKMPPKSSVKRTLEPVIKKRKYKHKR